MALNIPYPSMKEPTSDAPTIQSVRGVMLQKPEASAQTITQAAAADSAQRAQQETATAIKQETADRDVAIKDFAAQKQLDTQKQNRIISERIMAREAEMQKLDSTLYKQLTADRDRLIVDKEGMKYMNEQQLMEHKIRTVKTQGEWQAYQQREAQLTDAKLQMMEIVNKKMLQQIELESSSERSRLNQEHMKTMTEIQRQWEADLEKEKKKAAKRSGVGALVNATGQALLMVPHPYAKAAGATLLAAEHLTTSNGGGGVSGNIVK